MENDIKYIINYFTNLEFVELYYTQVWSDIVLTIRITTNEGISYPSSLMLNEYSIYTFDDTMLNTIKNLFE